MENSSTNTPAQSDSSIQEVSQQSGGNIAQSSVSSQPPTHQGKILCDLCYFKLHIYSIIKFIHRDNIVSIYYILYIIVCKENLSLNIFQKVMYKTTANIFATIFLYRMFHDFVHGCELKFPTIYII